MVGEVERGLSDGGARRSMSCRGWLGPQTLGVDRPYGRYSAMTPPWRDWCLGPGTPDGHDRNESRRLAYTSRRNTVTSAVGRQPRLAAERAQCGEVGCECDGE
jgi:hypothetical protein